MTKVKDELLAVSVKRCRIKLATQRHLRSEYTTFLVGAFRWTFYNSVITAA